MHEPATYKSLHRFLWRSLISQPQHIILQPLHPLTSLTRHLATPCMPEDLFRLLRVRCRSLAARLSARVSEMVLSEQRSAAAAEAAARRLVEVQRAHETEVAAMREVARAKEKVLTAADSPLLQFCFKKEIVVPNALSQKSPCLEHLQSLSHEVCLALSRMHVGQNL